jgi:hypothetical protein
MVFTDPWGEESWGEGTQDYASEQFGQEHWWQNIGGKALAVGMITVHAAFDAASVGAVSKIDRAQEQLDRGQIGQNEYWKKVGYAGANTAAVMAAGGGAGALAARGAAAFGLSASASSVVAGVGGGLAGQASSDVVANATGEQKGLSSWQSYVGAGVMGGAFGYLGAKYQVEKSVSAASEPVMQTEGGIKPVEEAPQSTNREYVSDEVTAQARAARNAPNAAKISTDVPADNYNHGPFIVPEEGAAGAAAYGQRSLGAGEAAPETAALPNNASTAETNAVKPNTEVPSSQQLGKNLEDAGIQRPADTAAHHIVAGYDPRAMAARQVLQREGIGINEADNGVFLPRNTKVANPTGAQVHSKLHTNAYYNAVNEAAVNAPPGAVRDVLADIAEQLQQGTYTR